MKKISMIFIMFIIVLVNSSIVFAGDVPEALLHSDDSQIFFGEILNYDLDYNHPKDETYVEVKIVEVIKGDIEKGTIKTYSKASKNGNHNIEAGKIYLLAYCDEVNPTYIFDVTTYNTKTLKLKNTGGGMWDRFEKNLNQGKYGEAKIEGITNNRTYTMYGIAIIMIAIIVIGLIIKYRNNKTKEK